MKSAWNSIVRLLLEDTSTTGAKFDALDGLRGVAVLTVFVSHSSAFGQRLIPWAHFHGMGHLGVYLFFVLSGFLLAHALLARPQINFTGFWLRRFFRIAPLYYAIVATVFACQLATHRVYTETYGIRNLYIAGGWSGFLKHIVFLKGNSVFWTIAAEFEFYFLLPFLVLALMRWGRAAAVWLSLFAVAYCGWALAIVTKHLDPRYAAKIAQITHPTQYVDVFLCGILAAWLWRSDRFHQWYDRYSNALGISGFATAAALLAASVVCVADRFFMFHREWLLLKDLSLLYGAGFAWITLTTLKGAPALERCLRPQWLRIIGVTGFSWYLIHFPILNFVNWLTAAGAEAQGFAPWSAAQAWRWGLSFLLTAAASAGLYLLIEKPFMMLSRAFLKRKPALSPVEVAPV